MKSHYANKMNEIKPHMRWAQRILKQAHVYGVYHESVDLSIVRRFVIPVSGSTVD